MGAEFSKVLAKFMSISEQTQNSLPRHWKLWKETQDFPKVYTILTCSLSKTLDVETRAWILERQAFCLMIQGQRSKATATLEAAFQLMQVLLAGGSPSQRAYQQFGLIVYRLTSVYLSTGRSVEVLASLHDVIQIQKSFGWYLDQVQSLNLLIAWCLQMQDVTAAQLFGEVQELCQVFHFTYELAVTTQQIADSPLSSDEQVLQLHENSIELFQQLALEEREVEALEKLAANTEQQHQLRLTEQALKRCATKLARLGKYQEYFSVLERLGETYSSFGWQQELTEVHQTRFKRMLALGWYRELVTVVCDTQAQLNPFDALGFLHEAAEICRCFELHAELVSVLLAMAARYREVDSPDCSSSAQSTAIFEECIALCEAWDCPDKLLMVLCDFAMITSDITVVREYCGCALDKIMLDQLELLSCETLAVYGALADLFEGLDRSNNTATIQYALPMNVIIAQVKETVRSLTVYPNLLERLTHLKAIRLANNGHHREACRLLKEAAALYQTQGDVNKETQVKLKLGEVLQKQGLYSDSIQLFTELTAAPDPLQAHEAAVGVADVQWAMGDSANAIAGYLQIIKDYENPGPQPLAFMWFAQAGPGLMTAGDKLLYDSVLFKLGVATLDTGDPLEAVTYLEKYFQQVCQVQGHSERVAEVCMLIGIAYDKAGLFYEAEAAFERCKAARDRKGPI